MEEQEYKIFFGSVRLEVGRCGYDMRGTFSISSVANVRLRLRVLYSVIEKL